MLNRGACVGLLFSALAAIAATPAVTQTSPCIAYLSNGELRANCGGKDVLLLKRRGLASFAIGVDGGTVLGGLNWAYLVRAGAWTKLEVSPATWVAKMYSSCGAALAPHGDIEQAKQVTFDVTTARKIRLTDLKWPHCSADRSLIVGLDKAGDLVTNRGRVLVPRGPINPSSAVSPSGRWVAFFRGSTPPALCISDTRDWSTRCVSRDAAGHEGWLDGGSAPSVNDAGETLLEAFTSGACWYADQATIVSRTKFPGAGPDACTGVAIASPTAAPRVIIPLGFRPAWVDKKVLQAQFGVFKK